MAMNSCNTENACSISVHGQVGALKHMGVHITDSEAKAAVNYYDLDGSGAMSYDVRYTHEVDINMLHSLVVRRATCLGRKGLVGDFGAVED